MNTPFRPARTDTFEHTITGLLTKRADLWNEAERLNQRVAELRADLAALDRTLGLLGYSGDLDGIMPRQRRGARFGHGQLSRAIYAQLREAEGPLTTRQIAEAIAEPLGADATDAKQVMDLKRRAGVTLRDMRKAGNVRSVVDGKGNVVWERRAM